MAYDIRPLSFGEVLDRSLRLLVANAPTLVAISAIFWIPERLVASLGAGFRMAVLVLIYAVGPLIYGAIIEAVAEIYMDQPATVLHVYREVAGICLPFFGTYLLYYLPALLMLPVGYAVAFLKVTLHLPLVIAALPGVLAFLPMSYIFVSWGLLGPVMIVERRFGVSALRRSAALVNAAWWRTLGISVTAGLIGLVPLAVFNILLRSLPLVGPLLSGLAASIISAYSATVIIVYYFDRLCRLEDFDIHHLAAQIRSEAAAAAEGASSVG